ncbi:MAG TPA: AraC family transcriptional regulator [Chitinophaga sp.]|uniref:helix-turn-helix domain-containing protein n=1 Tax=Chitinophaga sp. TaxID=1869181 RepID=UPI002DB9D0E9|nr:AraC family transcriptional regulator [Chitinophaga sp.]HEU4552729.1 AraC family transcriptional regulator [Chitinophaga sp.]
MQTDKQVFLQFADKIGYDIGKNLAQNVEIQYQKIFDFLPELAMFAASYVVKKSFTRQTTAPKLIKDSICFFFLNTIEQPNRKGKVQEETPYVSVFPAAASHKSYFKKGTRKEIVSISVSAGYLKDFLKEDAQQFRFLFDGYNNFLVEEIMTDDILRTVNDIVKREEPGALKSYYYKLKAIELLFYLFQSLSKREKSVHQKLSENDIQSIYKVRDKIMSSLNKPSNIAALKQIAGMNELKMRKLFTQVFGMGIYDYYQHLRMKEAARLLRDEKLLVSEVGYQMGFENLSHFARVFEKHIGKKPKKYSSELR